MALTMNNLSSLCLSGDNVVRKTHNQLLQELFIKQKELKQVSICTLCSVEQNGETENIPTMLFKHEYIIKEHVINR